MTEGIADDLRQELALVEEELAELTNEVEELRGELGSRTDEPADPVDRATLIEALNMQEALLEGLRARRDELRDRLGH